MNDRELGIDWNFISERHLRKHTNPDEVDRIVEEARAYACSSKSEADGDVVATIFASVRVTDLVLARRGLPTVGRDDGSGLDIQKLLYLGRLVGLSRSCCSEANMSLIVEEAMLYADRQDGGIGEARSRESVSARSLSEEYLGTAKQIREWLNENNVPTCNGARGRGKEKRYYRDVAEPVVAREFDKKQRLADASFTRQTEKERQRRI